jgi:hypothetical protein
VPKGPTRRRPERRSLPEILREEWRSVAGLCNGHKGPNLSGIDWSTARGKLTRLFNPRRHKWGHHFRYDGPVLVGKTAIGRATILTLAMNDPVTVALRQELIEQGAFPP